MCESDRKDKWKFSTVAVYSSGLVMDQQVCNQRLLPDLCVSLHELAGLCVWVCLMTGSNPDVSLSNYSFLSSLRQHCAPRNWTAAQESPDLSASVRQREAHTRARVHTHTGCREGWVIQDKTDTIWRSNQINYAKTSLDFILHIPLSTFSLFFLIFSSFAVNLFLAMWMWCI